MIFNKFNLSFLILAMLISMSSCSEWLDVNNDPNFPVEVNAESILPVGQVSVGAVLGGDLAIVSGLWSQHWTQSNVSSQYKTLDAYNLSGSDFNGAWSELYAGALNDLQTVKVQSEASGNWNLYLQAVVMQTIAFQTLADFFDKVPYSEALRGLDNLSPKFDNGKEIYAGLIADLDLALSKDFNAVTSTKVPSDLVFGNSSDQVGDWIKFANTLKLKLLLRQSASSEGVTAIAKIGELMNSGAAFLDKDAGIIGHFIDEPNRSNFLYENNVRQLNVGTNLRMSRTIESFLNANNDLGRMDAYFIAGNTGQYGLPQGDYEANTQTTPGGKVSVVAMTALDPYFFISYDESLFLQAEARLRLGQDISTLYYQAINAAYSKFGLSTPTELVSAGGAYEFPIGGNFDDKLKALMTQKWLAMFKQGIESFLDQARTGIPAYSPVAATEPDYVPGELTHSVNAVTAQGKFPKRLLYPTASSDVNTNTPAQVAVTDKIWWMP